LILNQYLPNEELYSSFQNKKSFDDLEFILKNLLPENNRINSIYTEKELLGQIHHATHLDEYTSKSFRKKLYECSKVLLRQKWQDFFSQCKKLGLTETVEFEWGQNDETKNFINFFQYPKFLIPNDNIQPKTYETITPGNNEFQPHKVLHNYQMPIVTKVLKKLKTLNARCLIQMPTGTGKTRTAMEIICRVLNENKEQQIVWFADKAELLDQAVEEFILTWNHLGKFPIEIVRAYGSAPISNIPKKGCIIFANYDKLNNILQNNTEIKPHYVVVDEAHRIIAPTYKLALRNISDLERATRVIGLTATPGRGLDYKQNQELVKEFDKNIVEIELSDEDKESYQNNIIRYLEEEEEVLAKAIIKPIKTDIPYTLTDEEYDQLTKYVDGDKKEIKKFLKKLADNNTRNMLIIDKLRELAVDKKKKILYFGTDLTQSIIVFAALQKLGINAVHVDGNTDKRFRRQIIQKFKNTNEISIICNFDIFATGFDVKKLDVVFIARPVNSPVLFNQMIGRGTRGPRVGGTETFSLIQIIDKIKHSRFVGFDPYEQYGFWDENWKNE
jgi:DNA repair protein RadD